MADFPLTPSFFKKLGIYQDLMDIRRNEKKSIYWDIESACLRWTATGHHHLASPLDSKGLFKRMPEILRTDEVNKLLPKVMGNLCQHGYAHPLNIKYTKNTNTSVTLTLGAMYDETLVLEQVAVNSPHAIVFSPDGLLAGRVLHDRENILKRIMYDVLFWASWLTIAVIFAQNIWSPFWNWLVNQYIIYSPNILSFAESFLKYCKNK